MKNNPFELTSDQKKIIQDISSLCGVKQETVSQVWKYTLLMNYLSLLENRKVKNHMIQIPFIGKIWVHQGDSASGGAGGGDEDLTIQPFFTESFSEMIRRLKTGDDTKLVKYFEEEFIDPVLTEIEES
jgi:hypothetical protein